MRSMQWVLFCVLGVPWWATGMVYLRAEIVDRIRATVNDDIIAQSDLQIAMALRAVYSGKTQLPSTSDVEETVLQQLIDHRIILKYFNQPAKSISISPAEIEKEVDSIRSFYKDAETFTQALQSLGLTRTRLQDLIRERLWVLKLIDQTFRPRVSVAEGEIASYYNNTFVPRAKREGVTDIPPLPEIKAQLEQILVEQRISHGLDAWLRHERAVVTVRVLPPEGAKSQKSE